LDRKPPESVPDSEPGHRFTRAGRQHLLLCYAARMAGKPRIAIIGPGNLGSALAMSLYDAGYKIDAIVSRAKQTSRRKAQVLAKKVEARAFSAAVKNTQTNLFWFCVPDGEIAKVAIALADPIDWKGKIALHSSGALTSDALAILRRRGAAVASVHPMMTFVPRAFSRKSKMLSREPKLILAGVPFAIEGDASAIKIARQIVKDLGATAYAIRKRDKAAYHAWGTFASPLLTALLVTTEHVVSLTGIERKSARRRMIPILQQTLENYVTRDAADAFSGPFIRGDLETVKRHLQVLGRLPAARRVYEALAEAALEFLPSRDRAALRKILRGS
jgi:predicted short-subunit dehydrogenase-like oxidoreductase (DUF2520 family)